MSISGSANAIFTNGHIGRWNGGTNSGNVTQSNASTVSYTGSLTVGDNQRGGGIGFYTVQDSSTLSVGGSLALGNSGAVGTFTQSSSGSVTVGNTITVGNGGYGTLNLSNGTITTSDVIVGNSNSGSGYGIVNQTGGALNNGTGWAQIGNSSAGGEYNISAGTFSNVQRSGQ